MLIRFVVENLFSFGERAEYNMLPAPKLRTLKHHKYKVKDINLLKMGAIYGANAAGKSNLIKALSILQEIVVKNSSTKIVDTNKFKFFNGETHHPQIFTIEFIAQEIPYYYSIEIKDGTVTTEELYLSGLGRNSDKLIFMRSETDDGNITLKFDEEFEKDKKSKLLKSILVEEFISPDKLAIKIIANRENPNLKLCKTAFNWFKFGLNIIMPNAKPTFLLDKIEIDKSFSSFLIKTLNTFSLGIINITSEKMKFTDLDLPAELTAVNSLVKNIRDNPMKLYDARGDEFEISLENQELFVKRLKIEHQGGKNKSIYFYPSEESDGTLRLFDFVPAFSDVLNTQNIYFIDEIERSIHPALIKELVRKFSLDKNTQGQLIFTTHESNLLDQDIFRQDEIWFAEKNCDGMTDLYSLSDFKEHHTIDIRKGYLNGRYGAIPFTGNLRELNWHMDAAD